MMRRAFTLVELSVVLVVIGLLIGGIIAGKALIQGSEVKNLARQALSIQTAFLSFRDQYGYLPGDYPKAVSLWGTDTYGCPSNNNQTPRKTTCNGDGDGKLNTAESFHAWQHLADAGLISGSFTGENNDSTGSGSYLPGVNMPATKRANVGIHVIYWNLSPLAGNLMMIGGKSSGGILTSSNAALTTQEAYLLDQKYDDSLPQTGLINIILYSASPFGTCTAGTNAYNTAADGLNTAAFSPGCAMVWQWESQ